MTARFRVRPGLAVLVLIGVLLPFLTILLTIGGNARAQGSLSQAEKLTLVSGRSMIFETPRPVTRISEPDPAVLQYVIVSPHQIYLTGKSAGITNLIIWHDDKRFTVRDIEVVYDVSRLKEKLHEVFPEEKDLQVIATSDSITLLGRVSSTAKLSHALSLAEAFTPKNADDTRGKIINLVQVGGIHQVMLEVRIAEMKRTIANRLGINITAVTRGGNFGITTLGGLSQVVKANDAVLGAGPLGLAYSSAVNALFRFTTGNVTWTGFIDALNQDGLVKILAKPTLITQSGQTASFLAGGEYPIPISGGFGETTIEFKEFGVRLVFTPTVLNEDKISIQVEPEVSELDFSFALRLEGYVIPGLSTRKAATVVELGDGQSFAIAGLLQETIKEDIQKYPLLGNIPILGALFRSSSFQKSETELVIIATPHLVKPLEPKDVVLPGEHFTEPSYTEFFLEGLIEGREDKRMPTIHGEVEGPFGYSLPETN